MVKVCRFLLKDASVPWQIRIRRAQGLLVLGEVFSDVAKAAEKTELGRELIESALIGAVSKEGAK